MKEIIDAKQALAKAAETFAEVFDGTLAEEMFKPAAILLMTEEEKVQRAAELADSSLEELDAKKAENKAEAIKAMQQEAAEKLEARVAKPVKAETETETEEDEEVETETEEVEEVETETEEVEKVEAETEEVEEVETETEKIEEVPTETEEVEKVEAETEEVEDDKPVVKPKAKAKAKKS